MAKSAHGKESTQQTLVLSPSVHVNSISPSWAWEERSKVGRLLDVTSLPGLSPASSSQKEHSKVGHLLDVTSLPRQLIQAPWAASRLSTRMGLCPDVPQNVLWRLTGVWGSEEEVPVNVFCATCDMILSLLLHDSLSLVE